VVLLLIGGTLLKIAIAGTFLRYVKPGARPLLLAAGAVLLVVAAASLWQALLSDRIPGAHAAGSAQHPDHDEVHRSRIGWLLLAPALALLVISPPALGSFEASRSGTALSAPADSEFPPLPAGDPARISVLDYATRAVFDQGASLQGHHVRLSGFVMMSPSGTPYLARMVITCCAADAQPIKVGLAGAVPAGLNSGAWIEVTGAYSSRTTTDEVNTETIPFIEVSTSRPIPAPSEQYVS
jgi:uncharacterized repeat protein (TIGR03943 family)